MTIVSALALGILTDRAVLFDWPHSDPVKSGAESIGQADFYDIFAKPPIAFELQRVLAYHHVKLNDFCPQTVEMINPVLDLNSQLPQSVLVIERYDFWGAALFLGTASYTLGTSISTIGSLETMCARLVSR